MYNGESRNDAKSPLDNFIYSKYSNTFIDSFIHSKMVYIDKLFPIHDVVVPL